MTDDIDNAWRLVRADDDFSCDEAARVALAVAADVSRSPKDRADALFLLGQIARFFQPWRRSDAGLELFRRATTLSPDHVDSLLAQCELMMGDREHQVSDVHMLLDQVETLRAIMTHDQLQQLSDITKSLRM
jgi:hypothetical protein